MKIRFGFVTNSSSSSFIVAYNNEDEMEQINAEYRERIKQDILNGNNRITIEQALDAFEECCYYSIAYDTRDRIRKEKGFGYQRYAEWQKWEKEHEAELEAEVTKELEKQKEELRSDLEGKDIISIITYSDDESEEDAVLENYCYDMEGCYAVLSFH